MSLIKIVKRTIANGFASLGYDISRKTAFGKNGYSDFRQFLSEPKIIFDVGANEGQTALELRSLFPRTEIICFEPSAESFQKLRTAVAAAPNIRSEQLALGDVNATATLYENANSVTNSLLPNASDAGIFQPEGYAAPKGRTQVRVTTLDAYCKDAAISEIDLLKIDAQGYEQHILRGGSKCLERHLIKAVFLEVCFVPLYDGQASFSGIYDLLVANRYALIGLYGLSRSKKGKLLWCDALFVADETTQES